MIQPTDYLEPAAPQAAPDFIEMRGISKRFGGVRALSDVSFSIRAAEIHCLAGENGCGKSTLIKILSGVYAPDDGQIILEGQAHSHLSPPPLSVLGSRSFTRTFRSCLTSRWLRTSRSDTRCKHRPLLGARPGPAPFR